MKPHLRARILAPLLPFLLLPSPAAAAPKALFDNTHAETAGNADWQIDTDQPLPVPDQSTVTQATPRTYWLGAISSWAIDLVKRGYFVASLTPAYGITYGNPANAYDLSKYDVFIVDEPNTRFTSAESTAIFNYVREGGGLVAVADHMGSDRNSDGVDSPRIWGRLDTQHLWGMTFDTTSTSVGTASNFNDVYSTNVNAAPDDSIINGPNGYAGGLEFHNGTSMALDLFANPTVAGDVWRTGFAQGATQAMAAHSVYENGRVFMVGDSSPADDGSAAPGNSSIFDGWGEANGLDSLVFLNGTQWVTRRVPIVAVAFPNGGETLDGLAAATLTWTSTLSGPVKLEYQIAGMARTTIAASTPNDGAFDWTVPNEPSTEVKFYVSGVTNGMFADSSDATFTINASSTGISDPGASGLRMSAGRPNPSRGEVRFDLEAPATFEGLVEVFDPSGRRVARLHAGTILVGHRVLTWDGRAGDGSLAPPGLYLVRATGPGFQAARRFVRVR